MTANEVFLILNKAILAYKFKLNRDSISDRLHMKIYDKCLIDCQQWDLEDKIRVENIDPKEALSIKRKIDELNHSRTKAVEDIDEYIVNEYKVKSKGVDINSETAGWLIDRMSVLSLKLYHMSEKLYKDGEHEVFFKLTRAKDQYVDLSNYFDTLFDGIIDGTKGYKAYKQLKMYK